jgi:hypothetical protein
MGSGATKFKAVIASQMSIYYRLRSAFIEGDTAASAILSTPNKMKAAVREKTRRPAQHTATAPNFLITHCGVDT